FNKTATFMCDWDSEYHFLCFEKSRGGHFKLVTCWFGTEEQIQKFEQALNNKDFYHALDIAHKMEKLSEGEQPDLACHPLSFHISGYLKEQEKIIQYNSSYCVTHGIFKKEKERGD